MNNTSVATASPHSIGQTNISHDVETHVCPACWAENDVKRLYIPLLIEQAKPWHCWRCAAPIHLSDPEAEQAEAEQRLSDAERAILAAMPRDASKAMTAEQLADAASCVPDWARTLLRPSKTLRRHFGVIHTPGVGYFRP